ncbi:MAG: chemotaxis protein CheX [Epulopiscium sp.]|jgi:chemotaxis protein CheX|nr:chemotaxis protein CheX [Defluviitalea raffinosedens]MBM7686319.1 chemotaxis protein CheX [Defluviitalea raffinosedens]MDK2788197.1 chemotaxis protein CheX [Candidatus Epulonipiscium sp.]
MEMVDELYKAFVDSTYNVFNLMFNISDISVHSTENFTCDDEIDIVVGIVGELQGEVTYRFPVATSLSMVNIMSGMEFEDVDIFVTSAISEVANIISGNVVTALSDHTKKYDILPPVQGKPDDSKEYEIESSCCVSTSIGGICLKIGLNSA